MTDKFEVLTPGVLKSEGDVFKTVPLVTTLPDYTSDYRGCVVYTDNGDGTATLWFGGENGWESIITESNGSATINGYGLTVNSNLTVYDNGIRTGDPVTGPFLDMTDNFLTMSGGSVVGAVVTGAMSSTTLPNRPAGTLAFNTDADLLYVWDGTVWREAGHNPPDYMATGGYGYAINTAIPVGGQRNVLNFQDTGVGPNQPSTLNLPFTGTWSVSIAGSVWGWSATSGMQVDAWVEWSTGGGGQRGRARVPSNNSGVSISVGHNKIFTGASSLNWNIQVAPRKVSLNSETFSVMGANVMVVAVRGS